MSNIKISQLADGTITLESFLALAGSDGVAFKGTVDELQTFVNTIAVLGLKAAISAADAAPTEDGLFPCQDTGTYTNFGGLVVDVSDTITFISVSGTQTVFKKVEIPITITIDATVIDGSTNAIQGNAVFDANIDALQYITTPPDELFDANTLGWFDSSYKSSLDIDEFNRVSNWRDKRENGVVLINDTANDTKPISAKYGVQFDGQKSTLRTVGLVSTNPFYVYLVLKTTSTANFDVIISGENREFEIIQGVLPNKIRSSENSKYIDSTTIIDRETIVLRVLANNTASRLQINDETAIPRINNFQTVTVNDITIGCSSALSNFANVEILEVVFRNVQDGIYNDTSIYSYLKNKWVDNIKFNVDGFGNGKFNLTFDDARESVYTVAYPIMQAKGVKCTIYVNGGTVGTTNRMTWAQIIEMYNAGHDMQCHTYTHNTNMNSFAEVLNEFTLNNDAFAANGIPLPLYFAYPGVVVNDSLIRWIQETNLRFLARGISRYTDAYTMKSSYKWNYGTNLTDSTPLAEIQEIVDSSLIDKSAVTTYLHEVGNTPASLQMDVTIFEDMLDYVIAQGLDFVTTAELYALMDK